MEGKSLNEWANHLKVRSCKVLLRAVPLGSDTKQTAKKPFTTHCCTCASSAREGVHLVDVE